MIMNKDIDILVIDDFLTPTYFKQIQHRVLHTISWNYNSNISVDSKTEQEFPKHYKNELYQYGFGHSLFDDNKIQSHEMYSLLAGFYSQILDVAGCTWILSSNLFMTTFSGEKRKLLPHIDIFNNHTVALFYLTDSDAETIIYDEKITNFNIDKCIAERYSPEEFNNLKVKQKVIPKENRVVIFDGSYIHSGSTPETSKNRIVINNDIV